MSLPITDEKPPVKKKKPPVRKKKPPVKKEKLGPVHWDPPKNLPLFYGMIKNESRIQSC